MKVAASNSPHCRRIQLSAWLVGHLVYNAVALNQPEWKPCLEQDATGKTRYRMTDEGDGTTVPHALIRSMHAFLLVLCQSTVIRVPAVVPLISCRTVPLPKTSVGSYIFMSKVPS